MTAATFDVHAVAMGIAPQRPKPLIPFHPLSSKIVVQALDEKYKGLLVIPATAKKPAPVRAKVIAMGPGMLCKDGTRWPMPDCVPGDIILMRPNAGQDFAIDGERYLKIHDDDVMAVIEEDDRLKAVEEQTMDKDFEVRMLTMIRQIVTGVSLGVAIACVGLAVGVVSFACTKQQAVNVANTTVQVGVDICDLAPQLIPPGTPEGTVVALLCPLVAGGAKTVEVLIDTAIWDAMVKAYQDKQALGKKH